MQFEKQNSFHDATFKL